MDWPTWILLFIYIVGSAGTCTMLFMTYRRVTLWWAGRNTIKPLAGAWDSPRPDDLKETLKYFENQLIKALAIPKEYLEGLSRHSAHSDKHLAHSAHSADKGKHSALADIPHLEHQESGEVTVIVDRGRVEARKSGGTGDSAAARKSGGPVLWEILKLRFKHEKLKESIHAVRRSKFGLSDCSLICLLTLIYQFCGIL